MSTTEDRKTLVQKYRDYFYGVTASVFAGFKTRFMDPALTNTTLQMQQFNFSCQNEVRPILEKRIAGIPAAATVRVVSTDAKGAEVENEAQSAALAEWLAMPYFDGAPFESALDSWPRLLERDGDLYLMVSLVDGWPVITHLDALDTRPIIDPSNIRTATEFVCKYDVEQIGADGASTTVTITKTITAKSFKTESTAASATAEEQEHGFREAPVVWMRREDVDGEVYGRSGVADLIEPQDNLNRCLTNIGMANKYGGQPIVCAEESGAPTPDSVVIAPGTFIPYPVKTVNAGGAPQAMFDELEKEADHIYRIGMVSRNRTNESGIATADSGVALLVLNIDGRRYVADLIDRLEAMLIDLFSRCMRYSEKMGDLAAGERIVVEFVQDEKEDPTHQVAVARLLIESAQYEQAFERLGYTPEKAKEMADSARLGEGGSGVI